MKAKTRREPQKLEFIIRVHLTDGSIESGNSTSIIEQHYLQLMPPSTAEAWFSITPVVVHRYKGEQKKQQGEQKGEARKLRR